MILSPGKIDLHTHTTASDGAFSPAELVRHASEVGITTLAITDHDTVSALAEARRTATPLKLRIISGVEFGTDLEGSEVHMLAYFFDPGNPLLLQKLAQLRDGRLDRGKVMVDKLRSMGLYIEWSRVQAIATGESVGRPHIARALIEAGHVESVDEAFDKYLGHGKAAYIPRTQLSPAECIDLAHRAGGVASLAHPTWIKDVERLLPHLVDAGLDGLETYYGSYDNDIVTWLARLARQYDLVPTGGSDFHGSAGLAHSGLGSRSVPPFCLAELEKRVGARRAQMGIEDQA